MLRYCTSQLVQRRQRHQQDEQSDKVWNRMKNRSSKGWSSWNPDIWMLKLLETSEVQSFVRALQAARKAKQRARPGSGLGPESVAQECLTKIIGMASTVLILLVNWTISPPLRLSFSQSHSPPHEALISAIICAGSSCKETCSWRRWA